MINRLKLGKNSRSFIFIIPILILVLLFILSNIHFYNSGLLRPNFEIIHNSFNFNFNLMPAILLFVSAIYLFSYIFNIKPKSSFLLFLFHIFLSASLLYLKYYITKIEPEKLVIREEILYTEKIKNELNILHLTDIQSASIGDYERFIFDKINLLNPDIILYTGDFLQLNNSSDFDVEWLKLLDLFKSVNPRYGTFFVYGDTELELYSKSTIDILPLVKLSSSSIRFEHYGSMISIFGLNLYQSKSPGWAVSGINKWLQKESIDTFKIVMGHAPDYALDLIDLPVDLCLAGHTHGGQVRLPFIGPLTIYSNVPKEWARGFRKIGMPYLNVSAGAGSNRYSNLPPIRFNCPTEMTLIKLMPK